MADLPHQADSDRKPLENTGEVFAGGSRPRTPRWVKLVGLVALVLLALVVVMVVTGGGNHGPGRH